MNEAYVGNGEGEVSPRELSRFMELSLRSEDSGELAGLRQKVLKSFEGLLGVFRKYRGEEVFFENRPGIREAVEKTRALIDEIGDQPSQSQLEACGLFMLCEPDTEEKSYQESFHNLHVREKELEANLELSDYFEEELDWLEVLSRVVWFKGEQVEAGRKEEVREQCLAYLSGRVRVGLEDIWYMYDLFKRLVHPTASHFPFIRDNQSSEDKLYRSFCSYPELFINESAEEREWSLEAFLDFYSNVWLPTGNPIVIPYSAANIIGVYTGIHPHPDGNGTMASILLDHACREWGVNSINWTGVKRDRGERRDFQHKVFGWTLNSNNVELVEWFDERFS